MTNRKTIARLRTQVRAMARIMEAFPTAHMRFGIVNPDGTVEEPTRCADYCFACKLEQLQKTADEWKDYEAAARGACMQLAEMNGHDGPVLARIQAGQYEEALAIIRKREEREHRLHRAVVSVIAVEEGGQLDCCDEETHHVWVTALAWSGRRAYLTGASPFVNAAGATVLEDVNDLTDVHFYADIPLGPPPAMPEPGEHLEWLNLELAPPIEEVKKQLGIN